MRQTLQLLVFLLLLSHGYSYAQASKISGRITNATNEPLIGVSVVVSGTSQGTTSDVDGNYAVSAPSDATLVFSYVGYVSQTVAVKGRSSINVIMAVDNKELGEVVVTALGIKKDERKIGYAVTKVDGQALSVARETNVATSLQGRVAGLNIGSTSGGPGSSARLNIRGVTSFGGTSSPLIVINGVPIDNTVRGSAGEWGGADLGDGISNINPDDVESMTVLKGSTASALYGVRAANGVILITTKSGSRTKTTIEYNTNLQLSTAVDNRDFQTEYGQGDQNKRPVDQISAYKTGNTAWGEKLDGKPAIGLDGQQHPYSLVKGNNFHDFYRTAPAWTNTLSISGGGEKGVYRLSLSNLDSKSILRNSDLTRRTVTFTTQYDLTKKLSFGLVASYVDQQDGNRAYLSDAPMNANNILFLSPNVDQSQLAPGYDVNNNGLETRWNDDIYATNPWFVVNKFVNNIGRRRLLGTVSGKYTFTDYLTLQGRVGYDYSSDRRLTAFPTGTLFSNDGLGRLEALTLGSRMEMNSDALLSFNKQLNQDFTVSASVGGNYRYSTYESSTVRGDRFVVPYLYTPSNTLTKEIAYESTALVTPSVYYTADFTYKFLTIGTTGRYDKFSTLTNTDVNSKNSIFTPSVSGSFIFSDLLQSSVLSYGKLRASYAKTAGETTPYQNKFYYNVANPVNGIPRAIFDSRLPSLTLKPFSMSEYEVGTELKFFNNRIGVDVAYFHRETNGEIVQASQSLSTGFSTRLVNLGSTLNRGVEAALTVVPVSRGAFTWTSSFNITKLHNEVLDIDQTANPVPLTTGYYRPQNGYIAVVKGMAVSQVMAYDYKRDASGNVLIGSDGVPLRGDLKPMGSGIANLYGGWNNDFNFKGVNLSFLIDYRFNNKILSATEYYSYQRGLNQATLVGREDGIIAAGVTEGSSAANTQRITAEAYYKGLSNNVSSVNVLDGSFIKFRQLSLGYTIGPNVLGNTPFQDITLSLVGRNLFTIMKRTHNIDPENTFSPLTTYAGVEGGSLPFARTYGFTLNVKLK
jgi:TonB-linked SusC/RagA family outer membrane protein